MATLKLKKTKAGKGYKINLRKDWFFTSTKNFEKFLKGETTSCTFRTSDEFMEKQEDNKEPGAE